MEMEEYILSLAPSENAGKKLQEALWELSGKKGRKVLRLSPGQYLFDRNEAKECKIAISNTVTKEDVQFKHVALFLEGLEDLLIEGNGAEFLLDGDISAIIISNCRNIHLKDFSIDYVCPRVSEMTVLEVKECKARFSLHSSSRWQRDEKGCFCFVNGNGIREEFDSRQVVQVATPGNTSNLRSPFNPVRSALSFEETGEREFTFLYDAPPPLQKGEVWQFRDPSRRENGIMITDSENVTLEGLQLYFTPGLGVVAQMTKDLAILKHRHAPKEGSNRVCAALADCIQISSCYGKVEIGESFFSGAQDDPINIHGTYLGVTHMEKEQVSLEFCHPETWGFLPYKAGDEVAFVRKKDMQRVFSCHVKEAELTDPFKVLLTLDKELSFMEKQEEWLLENMSSYPDVFIHDCIFQCYPTRGILLSSAGKCLMTRNEIRQRAPRPALYIASDGKSWYESGGVKDVTIRENLFRYCPAAAIEIDPTIPPGTGIVHRGIVIEKNTFQECSPVLLKYHSTEEILTDIPKEKIEEKV